MDHDMYLLSLYFVLIGVSEQPGIFNDLFLIIDKEVNMPGIVMHHIRFDFFRQFFEFHTVSGAFYLNDMFRVQENIGPHSTITGILTDFSPCQWIKGFQILITAILFIPVNIYISERLPIADKTGTEDLKYRDSLPSSQVP